MNLGDSATWICNKVRRMDVKARAAEMLADEYEEIMQEGPWPWNKKTADISTTTGTYEYAAPTDMLKLEMAWTDSPVKRQLDIVDYDRFIARYPGYAVDQRSAEHVCYLPTIGQLLIHPSFTQTVHLEYEAEITRPSADVDTFLIPDIYQTALRRLALNRMYQFLDDSRYVNHDQLFATELRKLKRRVFKQLTRDDRWIDMFEGIEKNSW